MPSTPTGYVPLTAGERFTQFQEAVDQAAADLGLLPPNWTRREFTTFVGRILSQQLAEVDQIPATREDALDPNQLSGPQLLRLAERRGTPVNGATPSTVDTTVYAWDVAPVTLFEGREVSVDGRIWTSVGDVTIPAGGNATLSFVCEEEGAIELAGATELTIVTSVPGWTACVTQSAATPGDEGDSDAQIRARLLAGYGSRGSRSPLALQAAIEGLDEIEKARVVYNSSFAAQNVSGVSVPPAGVAVWVYPDTISNAVKLDVLRVLFSQLSHDTQRSFPATSGATGFVGAITSPTSGQTFQEGAWYMTESDIHVVVGISDAGGYAPGFSAQSLDDAITGAVQAYFQGLDAGDDVYQQELLADIVGLEGIVRLEYVRIKVGSTPGVSDTADIAIDPASFAICDVGSNLTIVHEP